MTLQQIRCFIAVAETLNFTKAAESIYITQSALSKQITALEQELGFPLLARTTKYVRLTPAGAVFLERCRSGLDLFDTAIIDAERASQGFEGELHVGWLESMNFNLFLVDHIHHFQELYPQIAVTLSCMSFSRLNSELKAGNLDLIYSMSFNIQDCNDIVYNTVRQGRMYILMNKHHPLADRETVTFPDLANETFFTPEGSKNSNPDTALNRAAVHHGINFKRVFVPNLETVYLSVGLGQGVSLIDDHLRIVDDIHFVCKELSDEWLPSAPTSVMVWKRANLNPSLPLYTNLFM